MKKNVYLALLCAVTVICVIGGTLYHVGGWFWDGWFDRWGDFGKDSDGRTVTDAGDEDLEAFTALTVDADIADLTIEPGKGYHISWKVKRAGAVEYSVKDGVLEVTQRQPKRIRSNTNCDIIITVPAGTTLDRMDLDLEVGDCDISGVSMQALEVNASVGEVDVEHADLGNAVISASVGDVDLENCSFGNLDVNADVGEIQVDAAHSLEGYAFDLDSDIGGVEINGKHHKSRYQAEGSGSAHITLKADVGEIEVTY